MARTKQTKPKFTSWIRRPGSRHTPSPHPLQLIAASQHRNYAKIIELKCPISAAEQDPVSSTPLYYKPDPSSKGYIFIIPTGAITRNRNKYFCGAKYDYSIEYDPENDEYIKYIYPKTRHYIILYDIENDCFSKFIKIPYDEYINKFPEISGCFLDDKKHKLYILSSINSLMINRNKENLKDVECKNTNIWILDIQRKKWKIKRRAFKKCASWNIFGAKGHFIDNRFHLIYSNQYSGFHKILQFDDNDKCLVYSANNNSKMLVTRNKGLISSCYHNFNMFHGAHSIYIAIQKELIVIGVGEKRNEVWSLNMNKMQNNNKEEWTLCDDIKWPSKLNNFYCDASAVIGGYDGICFIFCHNKMKHGTGHNKKGNGGNLEIWCLDFIDKTFEKSTKRLPQKMDGWNGYPLSKYFISTNNGYCHYLKCRTPLLSTHCKLDLFDVLPKEMQKTLIQRIISKCHTIKTQHVEYIIDSINKEFNIEFEPFVHQNNVFKYLPMIIKDKLLKKAKEELDDIKYWNQILILQYMTENESRYNMELSHYIKTLVMFFYGFTL